MKQVIKKRFFAPSEVRTGVLSKFHIPTKWAVTVICGLAVLLPLLYLYQTNEVAQKGFEIRELEQRLSQLEQENFEMNQEVTKLQSGPTLTMRLENLEMEQVDFVDYLDAQYTNVAYVNNQSW